MNSTARLNQRLARAKDEAKRNLDLSASEQRFYSSTTRFEEQVRRACARSVVVFRSDIADGLARELEELERSYVSACSEAQAAGRTITELEARFGATVVLVHLQIIGKVNELFELAEAGTPVSDIRRLGDNLDATARKLADIEARSSVATTGDLNEEERNVIRFYKCERFVRIAEAVQLKREAHAAIKRHAEGAHDFAEAHAKGNTVASDQAQQLQERALGRATEIRRAISRLIAEGDIQREPTLDRLLKQVSEILDPLAPKIG